MKFHSSSEMTLMSRYIGESVSYRVKGIFSLSGLPACVATGQTPKRRDFGERCELLFQMLSVKMRHTQRPFPPSNFIDILHSIYQIHFHCSRKKKDGFARKPLSLSLPPFTLNFVPWHRAPLDSAPAGGQRPRPHHLCAAVTQSGVRSVVVFKKRF